MDINPGNRLIIIAIFIKSFLLRKRILDKVYATATTRKVDIMQLKKAINNVFNIICGKLNTEKSVNSLT